MTIADQARALAAEGLSHSEIAERLGISRGRVYSAVTHTGPRGRPRKVQHCPHCGHKLPDDLNSK